MARNRRAAVIALVVLAFPAAAGAAKDGTYVGRDQGKVKVRLEIKHNRITFFKGNPSGHCYGAGTTFVPFKYPSVAQRPTATVKVKRDGAFAVVFRGSRYASFKDDRRSLTGKARGRKVTGRMTVTGLCQVDQKFKAFRKVRRSQ